MKAKINKAEIFDNQYSYDLEINGENGGSLHVKAWDRDCNGQVDQIWVDEGRWVEMASLDNDYARVVSSAVTKFNEGLDDRISYGQRLFEGRVDGLSASYGDDRQLGLSASVWNEKEEHPYHVPVYEEQKITWTEALGGALAGGLGAFRAFRGDDHRKPIGYETREYSFQVLSATDRNRDGYCDYVEFRSADGVKIALYGGYGKDPSPSLDGNLMSARYYLDQFHFTPTS